MLTDERLSLLGLILNNLKDLSEEEINKKKPEVEEMYDIVSESFWDSKSNKPNLENIKQFKSSSCNPGFKIVDCITDGMDIILFQIGKVSFVLDYRFVEK